MYSDHANLVLMLGCTESEEQYFKFVIRCFNILEFDCFFLAAYLVKKYASRICSKVVNEIRLIYNWKTLLALLYLYKSYRIYCLHRITYNTKLNVTIRWIYSRTELEKDGCTCLPKKITTDVSTTEREKVYRDGGVLYITTREAIYNK